MDKKEYQIPQVEVLKFEEEKITTTGTTSELTVPYEDLLG